MPYLPVAARLPARHAAPGRTFSWQPTNLILPGHCTAHENEAPRLSPLAQSVTRDGTTFRIDICRSGGGGWILEVVDQHGNSTVWDESFPSDREALDEVLNTIDENGIALLIGPPAGVQTPTHLNQPLSRPDPIELDEFLADVSIADMAMDVSTLEGFMTAIVSGPRALHLPEWLPRVWDMQ